MRHRSHRRLRRGGGRAAAALLLAALVGCESVNEHPPDPLLVDSLGLDASDPVLTVELSAEDNRERPWPAEVTVPRGGFVDFRSTDRRLHTVRFLVDSLAPGAREFLLSTDQVASPPLLELGARFVVSFRDAPDGRYPYLVEGNGAPARGAVRVGSPEGG